LTAKNPFLSADIQLSLSDRHHRLGDHNLALHAGVGIFSSFAYENQGKYM
jgi:hypothetical protein